jgi:hypothetical protein
VQSNAGEPVEVEASARRAGIGAALTLLQEAAGETGGVVHNVVRELCLELVSSALPPVVEEGNGGEGDQLPFSCEVR